MQIEILIGGVTDARNAILYRREDQILPLCKVLESVDTRIIKAELSGKDIEFIESIKDTLKPYLTPLGEGRAISNDDRVINLLSLIACKVTETLAIINELQQRWQNVSFPRSLLECFLYESPERKKQEVQRFIDENKTKSVAEIAKEIKQQIKSGRMRLEHKYSKFRRDMGAFLPQLTSDDPREENRCRANFNNNLM